MAAGRLADRSPGPRPDQVVTTSTGDGTGRPRFGLVLRSVEDVAAAARRAEELGYDAVASGEHVAFRVPTPSSFVSLSVAAAVTERVRLLSTIVPLALYPAAVVAKMAAALDVVSGGRYELGVGLAGEYPPEFAACGVALSERGARCDEGLEVIERLWSGDDVSYEGRFNRFAGVTLRPRPVQRPRPPVWVAGRREGAMRRSATWGDGWLPYMYTPEMLASSVARVRTLRAKAGRPGQHQVGLFISSACHPDGRMARRWAAERLGHHYAQDFSERIGRYSLVGTPAECRARLAEYLDAGARTVVLASACPDDYFATNERLLAEEVLPLSGAGAGAAAG